MLGPSGRTLELSGRVGFDTLPDQLVNRELKRGFTLNILVIGETGVGKSTLLESLFKRSFESEPHGHLEEAVGTEVQQHDLEEGGVRLKLMIVNSRGFGDQLNRTHSPDSIVSYVDAQYERFLQEELKTSRNLLTFHDTRVHVCLYLLPPTGHTLKSVDLVTMRAIHQKVNLVPVIAKADTVTKAELAAFKALIGRELEANGIETYCPEELKPLFPLAVIGSKEEILMGSERVRVRQYPWGIVEVENEEHSDFIKLRNLLLRTNTERLRQRTHRVLYERYRKVQLKKMGFEDNDPDSEPASLREMYEQKRRQHMAELARREDEMRQMFFGKVKKKEAELKAAEQELTAKFEKLRAIHMEEQRQLRVQMQALEQERAEFIAQANREADEATKKKGKDKKDKKDKHS